MKITKRDIKTLEKIKKICSSKQCCEKCIFDSFLFCEMEDCPEYWDIEELKARLEG